MYILRLDLDSCKYWSFAILLIIIALVAYHYHYKNSAVKKESRSELEKKINSYIKEIDRCIALLGDQG